MQLKPLLLCLLIAPLALFGQGGSAGITEVNVPSGATPTLTTNAGITDFNWTLAGNVTSSTFSSAAIGIGSLKLCEDATGGRTVVFPGNFVNFLPMLSTAANYCQYYVWKYDGTNVTSIGGSPGGSVFTGSVASNSTGITGTAAAPIFSLSDQLLKSPVRFEQAITASTPVTGITINNKTAGAKFSIVWTQPSSNMASVTLGAAVSNTPCAVSQVASAFTEQFFEVASDGSTVYNVDCSSSDPLVNMASLNLELPTASSFVATALNNIGIDSLTNKVHLWNGVDGTVPEVNGVSNVTAQSTSQSTVTVATSPTAGVYHAIYYADLNTPCTTGSNGVSFTFNWTDGSNARSLQTGSLSMSSAQGTSNYLSGNFDVWIGSGNFTYTSTVAGSCASGTSSYDIHVTLERLQ